MLAVRREYERACLSVYLLRAERVLIASLDVCTWPGLTWDSNDGRLLSMDAEQSLYEAVATLRLYAVHRLIVVDSLTGNPLYVLNYKRILRFLHQSVSKGQLPLGPVPCNFLVANVTRKSPTSYGLVTRKSGVSPTCYGEVTRNWSQWNLAFNACTAAIL